MGGKSWPSTSRPTSSFVLRFTGPSRRPRRSQRSASSAAASSARAAAASAAPSREPQALEALQRFFVALDLALAIFLVVDPAQDDHVLTIVPPVAQGQGVVAHRQDIIADQLTTPLRQLVRRHRRYGEEDRQ